MCFLVGRWSEVKIPDTDRDKKNNAGLD